MRVQRRHDEIVDWLPRDGEVLVLCRAGVVRLGDVGATVFGLTTEPVEVEVLAARLVEVFGSPEGRSSLDATKDAVTELVRLGVLRRSA